MKRRGINLKAIEDSDPGLVELLTSDLCQRDTEEAEAFDPYRDDAEPTLGDVVDEVQEALEDALSFLHEGLAGARGPGRRPEDENSPPHPDGAAVADTRSPSGDEDRSRSGRQLPLKLD